MSFICSPEIKLVGTEAGSESWQGYSCSLSGDGSTLAVGGPLNNAGAGTTWIFVRSGTTWIQQGPKLIGTGAIGNAEQGTSCSLSVDGHTLAIGGPADAGSIGATWIFTRSGGIWTQQTKLVGTGAVGTALQGTSCALSADGNTLAIGGVSDTGGIGATWIFTQSLGVWTQQTKLVGTGNVGNSQQGASCALSNDGNTLAIGGPFDALTIGATWIFTRSVGTWTQQGSKLLVSGFQQGSKLLGSGSFGSIEQGTSCALSNDGNTLAVGGPTTNFNIGATWIFTRSSGIWTQQGSELVGSGGNLAQQGSSCSLSGDGNVLAIGGPGDNTNNGATWLFTRSAGIWSQQGSKLIGSNAPPSSQQGYSCSLSDDAHTLAVGGPDVIGDPNNGATWVFCI